MGRMDYTIKDVKQFMEEFEELLIQKRIDKKCMCGGELVLTGKIIICPENGCLVYDEILDMWFTLKELLERSVTAWRKI